MLLQALRLPCDLASYALVFAVLMVTGVIFSHTVNYTFDPMPRSSYWTVTGLDWVFAFVFTVCVLVAVYLLACLCSKATYHGAACCVGGARSVSGACCGCGGGATESDDALPYAASDDEAQRLAAAAASVMASGTLWRHAQVAPAPLMNVPPQQMQVAPPPTPFDCRSPHHMV